MELTASRGGWRGITRQYHPIDRATIPSKNLFLQSDSVSARVAACRIFLAQCLLHAANEDDMLARGTPREHVFVELPNLVPTWQSIRGV